MYAYGLNLATDIIVLAVILLQKFNDCVFRGN